MSPEALLRTAIAFARDKVKRAKGTRNAGKLKARLAMLQRRLRDIEERAANEAKRERAWLERQAALDARYSSPRVELDPDSLVGGTLPVDATRNQTYRGLSEEHE